MSEYEFKPDWVSHPGETLQDIIVGEFAEKYDIDREELLGIVMGYIGINDALAEKLESIGIGSKQFWQNRQLHYNEGVERIKTKCGGMQIVATTTEDGMVEVIYEKALHEPVKEKMPVATTGSFISVLLKRDNLGYVNAEPYRHQ